MAPTLPLPEVGFGLAAEVVLAEEPPSKDCLLDPGRDDGRDDGRDPPACCCWTASKLLLEADIRLCTDAALGRPAPAVDSRSKMEPLLPLADTEAVFVKVATWVRPPIEGSGLVVTGLVLRDPTADADEAATRGAVTDDTSACSIASVLSPPSAAAAPSSSPSAMRVARDRAAAFSSPSVRSLENICGLTLIDGGDASVSCWKEGERTGAGGGDSCSCTTGGGGDGGAGGTAARTASVGAETAVDSGFTTGLTANTDS